MEMETEQRIREEQEQQEKEVIEEKARVEEQERKYREQQESEEDSESEEDTESVEVPKKDLEFVRSLLSNSALMKFVKQYGADGLEQGCSFDSGDLGQYFTTGTNTVSLMDYSNTMSLVTQSSYTGKAHCVVSLGKLKEIAKYCPDSSQVIVPTKPNLPVFVEDDENGNVIVLAPKTNNYNEDEDNDSEDEEGVVEE